MSHPTHSPHRSRPPRPPRGVCALAALTLSAGLLSACSTAEDDGGDSATPGVSDDTITLGSLSTLTGSFAAGAKQQLAGAQLYWKEVNADGGVCDGRSVELEVRDNAYDPQKTVTAYSDISSDVLAIQLITGTATTQAIVPTMEQDQVSAIPMSWSPDLLDNESLLIPGTTYDLDMVNAVDYLLEQGDLKSGDTIGYLYFDGDFGGAGLDGAQRAADENGLKVQAIQVDPTVTDLSSQVRSLADADVKAILMSTNPTLMANAAAESDTNGLDVPIVVPTPTFVPEVLDSPAAKQIADRVMVVSPYNAWTADTPGAKDLRTAFSSGDSDGNPQQFFIAGYAAAQLMHDALERTCSDGDLTRESLKQAFADVEEFKQDGLSVDLDFRDRAISPSGSDYLLEVDPKAPGGLRAIQAEPYQGDDIEAARAGD